MRVRLVVLGWLGIFLILSSSGCRRPQPADEVKVEEPVPQPAQAKAVLSLEVEPASVRLEPGLSAKIKVAITRQHVFAPVSVQVRDLPTGVTAPTVTLSGRDS